ncbi:FAD-binding oxidoreductase [Paramesorhizobium deserti]|uniref:FAD-binding oxidoreductase n=1 Tax=Paramesorhizobium deserti TaxID=1494590 RepID=A0A135HPK7_9HYPH|nr:FAD-dependent oxidoreductase [Paramesorhizobium deserti]KXF75148.1 FAD-binding oxidoreductase [Paramesorhizobium deserti]
MTEKAGKKLPVIVIGAGIVGVSTAIWLLRDGHDVILVDRGEPGDGTSYGNGGVLASSAVVPVTVPGLLRKAPRMLLDPDQPLFLKWSYLPRLTPWLRAYLKHCTPEDVGRIATALAPIVGDSLADHQALSHGTGAEKWLTPTDYVFVYRDRAHFESDAFGWSIRRDNGFRWDELEGRLVRKYDPALAPDFDFAVRLGNHGRISDPGRYVKDLAAYVAANGGRIIKGEVSDVVRENGRVTGVRIGGETLPCSTVVLATGVWSKPLCRKLGLDVPLESERGYHVELWEPNIMPRSPVMVASGKFVVTPMDGRLRLAGIVEFGGLDAPASRAPFDLLIKQIEAVIPGLAWKKETEWMGHRPAPADSIPLIGEVPGAKGAYLGFGHHHIGLTGGPKTGRILAQLISGKTPNLDLAPYAPSRFQ